MKKKQLTPKSRITSALRRLWLRSRERAHALKRDDYTCKRCETRRSYKKDNPIKVVVHHKDPIDWDKIEALIRDELLVHPNDLETLCVECHKKTHEASL
jgi:5-methylcytosine-specific restriction endonuclease McrA